MIGLFVDNYNFGRTDLNIKQASVRGNIYGSKYAFILI
jgi:hypothetical protein